MLYPSWVHDLLSLIQVLILRLLDDIKAFIWEDLKSICELVLSLLVLSQFRELISEPIEAIDELIQFVLLVVASW